MSDKSSFPSLLSRHTEVFLPRLPNFDSCLFMMCPIKNILLFCAGNDYWTYIIFVDVLQKSSSRSFLNDATLISYSV